MAELLEFINLRGCTKVTDEALVALSEFCPRLHTVVLEGCTAVTNEGVRAARCSLGPTVVPTLCRHVCCAYQIRSLMEHASQLEHLNVAWCSVRGTTAASGLVRGCMADHHVICSD